MDKVSLPLLLYKPRLKLLFTTELLGLRKLPSFGLIFSFHYQFQNTNTIMIFVKGNTYLITLQLWKFICFVFRTRILSY